MAGVTRNEMELMRLIKNKFPAFTAAGLEEYIENQDIQGTKEARTLIQDIDSRLFSYIVKTMTAHFGDKEDQWWVKVPQKVRLKAGERREIDPSRKDPWSYLDFVDYRPIVHAHSDLFLEDFTLRAGDANLKKDKRTNWMVDINGFRQITHHAAKGSLTKDEVDLVRETYRLVMEKFQI